MANFVRFQMFSGRPLTINGDNPLIKDQLTVSSVDSITVEGDPWVFFDSPDYGGDFVIYRAGERKQFPTGLKNIKSVRMIKGGIDRSKVILYPHPFFNGIAEPFQNKIDQLPSTYFSLKVAEGAVIFFDDENCIGEKRILLNGDEVQNFTAVKLTSIGKSVKTAWDMGPQ
ncbi:gamma-crystallin N-A-like [Mauremys mutica]|uniref:gamma-crystallin N-A-like n=1 Tax=Mauremys mutica TaxID=74926 RepID=UPI001D15F822|nr:gamma-crystallin N-A-like [Mauremys mutica]